MYLNNANNNNADLPITALCIVADKARCPSNYTAVCRSHDTATEPDLWKDSLFGRRINRFICFTKDYPIADTYNVIEDIKLLNDRESLPGFIPLEKCLDTSEKAFQRKTLFIKISHRFYTTTAVSDLVLMARSKKPPTGFSYIGEINNFAICIKFSQIPDAKTATTTGTASSSTIPQIPPPIPPRPYSNSDFPTDIGGGFKFQQAPAAAIQAQQQPQSQPVVDCPVQSQHSQTHFNPLQGVPFEINPVYDVNKTSANSSDLLDLERINRKVLMFQQTLERSNYDFKLERSLIGQTSL